MGEVKSGDRTSSLGVDWVLEEPERGNLEEVSLSLQTRGGERKREHHEGHVSLNNEETIREVIRKSWRVLGES